MLSRAEGRGGTYGREVDCWSLGAVLYVMLVARFPEVCLRCASPRAATHHTISLAQGGTPGRMRSFHTERGARQRIVGVASKGDA